MSDVDVLVVGAGPVGLTLAVELARRQVPFRVVDAAPEPSTHSKALAIWEAAQRVFAAQGIIGKMKEGGISPAGVRVSTRRRTLLRIPREAFGEHDLCAPLILPQSQTERLLLARLEELGHFVERPKEFCGLVRENGGVTVSLSLPDGGAEPVRCRYLVGCDGAHSAVRHAAGFRFEGRAMPECFILCDAAVSGALPPEPEMLICLSRHGALPMFPLREGVWRIISTRAAHAGTAPPTLAEMQENLDARGPRGVVLSDPEWLSTFRISERQVNAFYSGGVLLAGDAAHIHSPAGGQGMNTGIQDAFNLGWKLEAILRRGAQAEPLLRSYEAERAPEAARVIAESAWRTRVAFLTNGPLAGLRDIVARLAGKSAKSIRRLAASLSGSRMHYPPGPLVGDDLAWHEDWLAHGSGPGHKLAEAFLESNGVRLSLLDLVLSSTKHTLIFYSGRRPNYRDAGIADEIRTEAAEFGDVLGTVSVWRGEHAPDESWLLDPEGSAHRAAGSDFASLVLVRPDGVVAARSQPADFAPLRAYLAKFL